MALSRMKCYFWTPGFKQTSVLSSEVDRAGRRRTVRLKDGFDLKVKFLFL